jgi:hypothetical protein
MRLLAFGPLPSAGKQAERLSLGKNHTREIALAFQECGQPTLFRIRTRVQFLERMGTSVFYIFSGYFPLNGVGRLRRPNAKFQGSFSLS